MTMKNLVNEAQSDRFFYFIDDNCLSCAACWKLIPEHFASEPVETKAYVSKQPTTFDEIQRCEEARAICPARVIKRIKNLSFGSGSKL